MIFCQECKTGYDGTCDCFNKIQAPDLVYVPDDYPKDDLVYRHLRMLGLTDALKRAFPDIKATDEYKVMQERYA